MGTVLGYFNHAIYHNNETLSKAGVRTMHYMAESQSMVTTGTPKPQDLGHFTDKLDICPTLFIIASVLTMLAILQCLLGVDRVSVCLQYEAIICNLRS